MKLIPRSLFTRLVLVLLAGLTLAQLASALVLFRDRGEVLYQASGMHSAQRIAEMVRLLESFGEAERARVVSVLNSPSLRVQIAAAPPTGPTAPTDPDGTVARLFATMVQHHLGADHPLRVAVLEANPRQLPPGLQRRLGARGAGAPGMPMRGWAHMRAMGMLPPQGVAFVADVGLRDGAWVRFESYVSDETLASSTRVLATLAILLASVLVLAVVAVRAVTRPLSVLASAAEALGRDLDRPPVPEHGPTEVRRAAHAFNTMQGRLARFIADRTRILTALSHDLKTPLTRLKLRAELVEDAPLRDSILRDLDEMQDMTAATLNFLKGMESEERLQPVDIPALIESLKDDAEDMGREVRFEGAEIRPYPARPLALKRCLGNLIDNAVKYGKRASVTATEQAGVVSIAVADEGPGIPEAQIERVFEPFYRLESSRNRETGGTGLGLSIARSIARAHGGDVTLRNRAQGGLEAVLTLPR